jgi:hypothetical protein
MNDHQRRRKHARTAATLEDLADTIRECAGGADDVTQAYMRRAALQFNERAGELRARALLATEASDVSLFGLGGDDSA